jgi:hypothetical protein
VAREAGRIIIRIGKQSVTFSCTGGQWASVQP